MAIPSLTATKCTERPVVVYGLFDPRDGSIFYVGVTTKRLCNRLASHVNDSRHLKMVGDRYERIRSIELAGMRTEIAELETVSSIDWPEAEQFWIENMRSLGFVLTNKSIGGPGALGTRQSAATKLARQVAAIGRDMSKLHTKEVREICASKLRHPVVINGVTYPGIKKAAEATGIPYSTIHYRLKKGLAFKLAA